MSGTFLNQKNPLRDYLFFQKLPHPLLYTNVKNSEGSMLYVHPGFLFNFFLLFARIDIKNSSLSMPLYSISSPHFYVSKNSGYWETKWRKLPTDLLLSSRFKNCQGILNSVRILGFITVFYQALMEYVPHKLATIRLENFWTPFMSDSKCTSTLKSYQLDLVQSLLR